MNEETLVSILIKFGLNDSAAQEAAEEIGKLTKNVKESGEVAERANEHHREMHHMFEMMNRTLPGLGGVMAAAFMGPVGAIMLAHSAIEAVTKKIEEAKKREQEFAAETSNGAFASAFKEVASVIDEARASTESYSLAVAHIAEHEITIAQALASQLSYMNALASARAAAVKAAEAAKKAEVERREKAGELTPEAAEIVQARDAITSAQKEAADKRQKEQDQINEKQRAMDAGIANQAALDADLRAKKDAATTDAAHRKALERFAPSDENRKVHQDLIDRKAEAQAAIEAAQGQAMSMVAKTGRPSAYGESLVKNAQEQFNIINQKLIAFETGERSYAELNKPGAKDASQAIQEAAKTAEDKARANAQEIDTLRRELDDLKRTANDPTIREQQDAELAAKIAEIMSNTVTQLYNQPRGQEVESGVGLADIIEKGGQVTNDQAKFMAMLDQALGGHAQSIQQAADHLEQFKDNNDSFLSAVMSLTNHGFTAQQRQIDQLSAVIGRIDSQTAALAHGNGSSSF
jgi:hypothetical protein